MFNVLTDEKRKRLGIELAKRMNKKKVAPTIRGAWLTFPPIEEALLHCYHHIGPEVMMPDKDILAHDELLIQTRERILMFESVKCFDDSVRYLINAIDAMRLVLERLAEHPITSTRTNQVWRVGECDYATFIRNNGNENVTTTEKRPLSERQKKAIRRMIAGNLATTFSEVKKWVEITAG